MSGRWFGVVSGRQTAVFDPCSGLTRLAPQFLPDGRHLLDDQAVAGWPVTRSRDLGLSLPVSLCWSPIVTCNFACLHCLDDKSVTATNSATRRAIAGILASSSVVGIDISGGEPLLLADLPELLAILRGGGRVASFTTNGWRLAEHTTALAGCVDAIRVSLDGASAPTHDLRRRKNSFKRAIEGIRASAATGIPVQVQTVIMRSNITELQAVIDLADAEQAKSVTFLQMLPIGEGNALAASELVSDEEASDNFARLHVPPTLMVRLRTRNDASGYTVVRADGWVWGNDNGALSISRKRPLQATSDLAVERKTQAPI